MRTPAQPQGAPAAKGSAAPRSSITASDLRSHVATLASDAMAGRPTPSPQLDAAADHIIKTYKTLGLRPVEGAEGFRQEFRCGDQPQNSANVIAQLPGREPEMIVVSAHYDHVGVDEGAGQDTIFNGANDNASGVAAMLEIADALSHRKQRLRRSVLFIAFCGEELGLRGSKHFVSDAPVPLETIVAVVNLEMLGRTEPRTRPRAWITGAELSTLVTSFEAVAETSGVDFVASTAMGPTEAHTFRRSDNYPFAQQGVVAHTVSTGHIDALYHSPDDEVDTMDFERMETIVRAIAAVVETLADSDATPAWTDEAANAGITR